MASKSSPARQRATTSRPISDSVSDVSLEFEAASADEDYLGHRSRLRDRFRLGGPDALPDYELLELVLFGAVQRRDTKPIAKALVAKFGSFADAIAAPRERLIEVDGVGDSVVTQLTSSVENQSARPSGAQLVGCARGLLLSRHGAQCP